MGFACPMSFSFHNSTFLVRDLQIGEAVSHGPLPPMASGWDVAKEGPMGCSLIVRLKLIYSIVIFERTIAT